MGKGTRDRILEMSEEEEESDSRIPGQSFDRSS